MLLVLGKFDTACASRQMPKPRRYAPDARRLFECSGGISRCDAAYRPKGGHKGAVLWPSSAAYFHGTQAAKSLKSNTLTARSAFMTLNAASAKSRKGNSLNPRPKSCRVALQDKAARRDLIANSRSTYWPIQTQLLWLQACHKALLRVFRRHETVSQHNRPRSAALALLWRNACCACTRLRFRRLWHGPKGRARLIFPQFQLRG